MALEGVQEAQEEDLSAVKLTVAQVVGQVLHPLQEVILYLIIKGEFRGKSVSKTFQSKY